MITVAEALRPEFTRTWHEAVAIVQEAAAQLVPGLNLPGPADMYLDDTGTLTFGFGSESSGEPVAALAGLLQDLLEGVDAPSPLRELAIENARSASHATVASFAQALAFFERPNRTSDIRAIASRLSTVRAGSSPDQEFARLRDKVAAADLPKEEKKKEKNKRQPRLSRRQQAAAIALLAIVVFGSLALRSGRLGSAVDRAEGGIQHVVSIALESFGVSKPASVAEPTATSDPAAAGAVEKDSKTASRAQTPSKTAEFGGKATPSGGTSGPRERRDRPGSPEEGVSPLSPLPRVTARHGAPTSGSPVSGAPPAAVAPSAVPPARDVEEARPATFAVSPAIYSNENPEVEAPVLVRPQLPREPAPGSDTGYFELIVDENGDVSQVKLISPRRKYYDRMLVSAAKAWKFLPAKLNGRPVKYRVHMPIIMAAMPGR